MRRLTRLIAIAALAAALAACTSTAAVAPATPSVDEEQATAIVERALAAYNDGDYAGWSANWDAAMKGAIGKADFDGIRAELMTSLGRYVSHGTPTLSSKTPGTFRWTFPVTFEKASLTFWIAFRDGTSEITGLRFE